MNVWHLVLCVVILALAYIFFQYARIRKLTERMGPMSEFGRSILTRGPEPMKRGKVYEYDQEPGDLVIAMQEVLDRRGQAETPPLRAFDEIVKREPYPVERKAKELVERLKGTASPGFCCCSVAAAAAASW